MNTKPASDLFQRPNHFVFHSRWNILSDGPSFILVFFLNQFSATRVQYLFFRRRPLSWSQTTYGIYTAVHHVIPGLALVILIPPMKKLLKLRDTTLIALGIASGALSELLLSLSTQTWMVFLGEFKSNSFSRNTSIIINYFSIIDNWINGLDICFNQNKLCVP